MSENNTMNPSQPVMGMGNKTYGWDDMDFMPGANPEQSDPTPEVKPEEKEKPRSQGEKHPIPKEKPQEETEEGTEVPEDDLTAGEEVVENEEGTEVEDSEDETEETKKAQGASKKEKVFNIEIGDEVVKIPESAEFTYVVDGKKEKITFAEARNLVSRKAYIDKEHNALQKEKTTFGSEKKTYDTQKKVINDHLSKLHEAGTQGKLVQAFEIAAQMVGFDPLMARRALVDELRPVVEEYIGLSEDQRKYLDQQVELAHLKQREAAYQEHIRNQHLTVEQQKARDVLLRKEKVSEEEFQELEAEVVQLLEKEGYETNELKPEQVLEFRRGKLSRQRVANILDKIDPTLKGNKEYFDMALKIAADKTVSDADLEELIRESAGIDETAKIANRKLEKATPKKTISKPKPGNSNVNGSGSQKIDIRDLDNFWNN